MAWNSNLRKGTDIPTWDWLSFFPQGATYHGTAHAYDGSRFFYLLAQTGSTGAASTTTLWKYDTWTDGWQYLATTTSGYTGITLKYDGVRNVLILTTGNASTEWRVYSLNSSNISMLGQTITPYTLTTITTVLPSAAGIGASLELTNDLSFSATAITGTAASGGSSTTVLNSAKIFNQGHAGMRLRLTSGTYSGQYRTISSVSTDGITATVTAAFGGTPAAGDTFIVEYAQGTATGTQSASTLQDTNQTWTTNFYANFDVKITSGTGSGQRRRIASNTANTLTLATTVTGNTNTGNWSVTPDSTSVYQIVPSGDFLYYASGTSGTGFYKIDLNTGASATTWTTLTAVPGTVGGGGDLVYTKSRTPYVIHALRGNATGNIYQYNIGLNTWTTPVTTKLASETFTTGSALSSYDNEGWLIIHVSGTTRIIGYNLSSGDVEPIGTLPYAAPGAYDGHRMCQITSIDGVKWLYFQRAAGQEFYRLAIEWM